MDNRDLPFLSQTSILDVLAVPVMVVDRNFRIIYANRAQKERYGQDMEGEFCHQQLRHLARPCNNCIIKLAMEKGEVQRKEMTNTLPSGQVIYGVQTATPLRDLAGRIAGAIETVTDISGEVAARRLLERKKQEAETLHGVSLEILAAQDLPAVLQLVVRKARELLGADVAILSTTSSEDAPLSLAADGLDAAEQDNVLREVLPPIIKELTSTGLPYRDTNLSAAGTTCLPGIRSCLAAPLRTGDRLNGVLAVGSAKHDPFPEDGEALLQSLANQAALALERSSLLETARSRADQLSLLEEIGGLLTVVSGEEETLKLVTSKLLSASRCDLVFITLAELSESQLYLASAASVLPGVAELLQGRSMPLENTLCQYVMDGGQPLHIPNAQEYPYLTPATRSVFTAHGINDLLAVPLEVSRESIGVLYLTRRDPFTYSAEELSALTVLAGQAATAVQNSRLYASLASYLGDILALQDVGSKILQLERDTDLYRLIVENVHERVPASLVTLDVMLPGRDSLTCVEGHGEKLNLLEHPIVSNVPPGSPLSYIALEKGQSLLLNGISPADFPDPRVKLLDIGRAIVVPLFSRKRLLGTLAAYRGSEDPPFGQREQETLTIFGNYAGIGLDNARLFRETRRLAVTDELTGLYNYRYLMECLGREIKQATRRGSPLGLLLLDLDHFKNINDSYGHQTGDHSLRLFAHHLRATLRSSDLLARYGGEEFVVILPDTDLEGSRALAEKLCATTRSLEIPINGRDEKLNLTVSIGVANYPDCGQTVDRLLQAADAALYDAKRRSRNCVSVAKVLNQSAAQPQ